MLAKTHGQPASPTRLGKEMMVFVERLEKITALNGFILFNTMVLQKSHQERNDNYIGLYTDRFKKSKLSKIEKHNELFIMQKIN